MNNPQKSQTSEELLQEIRDLKQERNAVIIAHNYQLPEIQDLADHTGDSLELSMIAAKTEADVIVFCGVRFMGRRRPFYRLQRKSCFPYGRLVARLPITRRPRRSGK